MSKFFDFINETLGSNRIFSREEVGKMKTSEFTGMKKAIAEQVSKIGVPSEADLAGDEGAVHVSAYTRDDGTHVREHWRARPSHGGIGGVPTGGAAPISGVNQAQQQPSETPTVFEGKVEYNVTKGNREKEAFQTAMYGALKNLIFNADNGNVPLRSINNFLNKPYPDARKAMNQFLHTSAPYSELKNEAQPIPQDLSEAMNKKYNLNLPAGWQGVLYDEDSPMSQAVSGSEALKDAVKSAIGKNQQQTSAVLSSDSNLFRAINKAKVFGIKEEKGYYSGYISDAYNFDWLGWGDKSASPFIKAANNAAFIMQRFNGHNYHSVIPFKIKK